MGIELEKIAQSAIGTVTNSNTNGVNRAESNTTQINPFENLAKDKAVTDTLKLGINKDTQNDQKAQMQQELKEAIAELKALLAQKEAQQANKSSNCNGGGCCGNNQSILSSKEIDERIAELEEKIQNLQNSLGLNNQTADAEQETSNPNQNQNADANNKTASNPIKSIASGISNFAKKLFQ